MIQTQYRIACIGRKCKGKLLQAWSFTPGDKVDPLANLCKEFELLSKHQGRFFHHLTFSKTEVEIHEAMQASN